MSIPVGSWVSKPEGMGLTSLLVLVHSLQLAVERLSLGPAHNWVLEY